MLFRVCAQCFGLKIAKKWANSNTLLGTNPQGFKVSVKIDARHMYGDCSFSMKDPAVVSITSINTGKFPDGIPKGNLHSRAEGKVQDIGPYFM